MMQQVKMRPFVVGLTQIITKHRSAFRSDYLEFYSDDQLDHGNDLDSEDILVLPVVWLYRIYLHSIKVIC